MMQMAKILTGFSSSAVIEQLSASVVGLGWWPVREQDG